MNTNPGPALMKLLPVVLVVSACSTYRPAPLDLDAHKQAWQTQLPDSQSVMDFVSSLSQSNDSSQLTDKFDPADGISLNEAEIISLVFNPQLRMARLKAGVLEAVSKESGRWSDPSWDFHSLKSLQDIPDPWIVSSGLSLTIPVSGRLQAEKRKVLASYHAELDRVVEEEWNVTHSLRDLWYLWSATQRKSTETRSQISRMDELSGSINLMADVGEISTAEARLFQIEQVSLQGALSELESKASEVSEEIRGILGISPSAPINFIPTLYSEPVSDNESLFENNNPSLIRLKSEYEVAEKSLITEIRKQYPDITIGPLGEWDEGQTRLGLNGAIPLPILNSNKSGIVEARAIRELARAEFETRFQSISNHLAVLRKRMSGVESRQVTIENQLAPLIDNQVSEAMRLIKLGEAESLLVLESLKRLYDVKLKLIDLKLDQLLTRNQIRLLTGPDPHYLQF